MLFWLSLLAVPVDSLLLRKEGKASTPALAATPILLSWNPRLILIDNFVSNEEIATFRNLAAASHWGSTGLVGINGRLVPGDTITSNITSLPDSNPSVISVKQRIADATMFPVEGQEVLHILRYEKGAFFRGHVDAHALPGRRTSSRSVTMIVNIGEGDSMADGPTYFPMAIPTQAATSVDGVLLGQIPHDCEGLRGKDPRVQSKQHRDSYIDGFDIAGRTPGDHLSSKEGIAVAPKPGRAIIWWSRRPDGQLDPRSQHAGCPPHGNVRPRKMALTQWIRHLPVVNGRIKDTSGTHQANIGNLETTSETLDWTACPGWNDGSRPYALPHDHRTCGVDMREHGSTKLAGMLSVEAQPGRKDSKDSDASGFFAG